MKQNFRWLFVLTLLIISFYTQPARAYDIFMYIDGIPGESLSTTHSNWNEVLSFSHGITKSNAASQPNHAAFTVVKYLDKSSPTVNLKLNQGSVIPKITVEFQKIVGAGTPVVFYKIVLDNVVVTGVSSTGSAGDNYVYENISISYLKITWTYTPFDAKGKAGQPVTSFWDVQAGKGS